MNFLVMVILLLAGASGPLSLEENKALDQLVKDNVVLECDLLTSDDVTGVVDASIIAVKVFHLYEEECTSIHDCGYYNQMVLKSNDTFSELNSPSVLMPYINPEIHLKSKEDAKEFEKMLDVLFPVFFSSGKEIHQQGNTWIFVREESFGELEGIVVTVDDDGTILAIEEASDLKIGGNSDSSSGSNTDNSPEVEK